MQALLFEAGGRDLLARLETLDEVLMPARLTPPPVTDGVLCGVLTLRGQPLPVIALQQRLSGSPSGPATDWTRRARILRVTVGDLPLGLIVDAVNAIEDLEPGQRRPALHQGDQTRAFLGDLWLIGERMVQEIHPDKLLSPDELGRLGGAAVARLPPGSEDAP